jgi:hypothetical protein
LSSSIRGNIRNEAIATWTIHPWTRPRKNGEFFIPVWMKYVVWMFAWMF